MTTQGAPRTTRKTTAKPKAQSNPLVRESGSDQELDLDQWLAEHGLAGARTMTVAGEKFEFLRAAPFPKIQAYNNARQDNDFSGALAHLLVDPDRAEALDAAIDRQAMPIDGETATQMALAMPIDGETATQMALAMLNFVVYGRTDPDAEQEEKAGESGAS